MLLEQLEQRGGNLEVKVLAENAQAGTVNSTVIAQAVAERLEFNEHTVIHQLVLIINGERCTDEFTEAVFQLLKPKAPPTHSPLELLENLKKRYCDMPDIKGVFGPAFPLGERRVNLELEYRYLRADEKKTVTSSTKEKEEDHTQKEEKLAHPHAASSSENASVRLFPDIKPEPSDVSFQKRSISLEDLFSPASTLLKENERTSEVKVNDPPDLVVLKGEAGYGKTTSLTVMARRWAEGNLWASLSFVFLITLRDLPKEGTREWDLCRWVYSIFYTGNTLRTIPYPEFEKEWNEVIVPLLRNKKVLFLLDGRDELPINHPFENIIQRLQADHIPTLMSSRPYGTGNIISDHREVTVVGFLDDDIEKYINFYFEQVGKLRMPHLSQQSSEIAKNLIGSLRKKPVLWEIARIPVILNALSGIVEIQLKDKREIDELLSQFTSLASVYEGMEMAILEREYYRLKEERENTLLASEHYQPRKQGEDVLAGQTFDDKINILQKYYQVLRRLLARLAFSLFSREPFELIFSHKDLKDVFENEKVDDRQRGGWLNLLLSSGIIRLVGERKTNIEDQRYEFLHLTVQEYYAAIYVTFSINKSGPNIRSVLEKEIERHIFNPRYEKLWIFLAGSLKNDADNFFGFIETIKKSKDLVGHRKLGILTRCLEESFLGAVKSDPRIVNVVKEVRSDIQEKLFYLSKFLEERKMHEDYVIPYWIEQLRLCPFWQKAGGVDDLFAKIKSKKPLSLYAYLDRILLVTPNVLFWILQGLHDKDREVRVASVEAVAVMGPAVATEPFLNEIAQGLRDKDREVRVASVRAVAAMGPAAATAPILNQIVQGLGDKDGEVQAASVRAVRAMGPAAATAPILNEIAEGLRDKDEWVRWASVRAVAAMGPAAAREDILEGIVQGLRDKDRWFRVASVRAVEVMGPAAATAPILNEIAEGLRDKDGEVRAASVRAVAAMGSAAAREDILEGIVQGLRDKDGEVRVASLEAVEALGPAVATEPILNEIAQGLRDKDRWVRVASVEAVAVMGPAVAREDILEGIVQGLRDKDRWVRVASVRAVAAMGSAAARDDILKGIAQGLGDKDRLVRAASAQAVVMLSPKADTLNLKQIRLLLDCLIVGSISPESFVIPIINCLKSASSLLGEEDPALLIAILAGSYLDGHTSMQVRKVENTDGAASYRFCYRLSGFIQQYFFDIEISDRQAQWICHFAPEVVNLLQQGLWSRLTPSYLERYSWDVTEVLSRQGIRPSLPPPPQDPLLLRLDC